MFWLEVLRDCKSVDEEAFKNRWSEGKQRYKMQRRKRFGYIVIYRVINSLTRIIKTTRETTVK